MRSSAVSISGVATNAFVARRIGDIAFAIGVSGVPGPRLLDDDAIGSARARAVG
jgi:hypothetical protein